MARHTSRRWRVRKACFIYKAMLTLRSMRTQRLAQWAIWHFHSDSATSETPKCSSHRTPIRRLRLLPPAQMGRDTYRAQQGAQKLWLAPTALVPFGPAVAFYVVQDACWHRGPQTAKFRARGQHNRDRPSQIRLYEKLA